MTLYRIGDTVLNMDRVSGILDHRTSTDAGASAGQDIIRILFDTTTLDLVGAEARTFRQWIRHSARNLAPHKDEDGEVLVSPEEQLEKVVEHLLELIDRSRPRDAEMRRAAHRLAGMIGEYITGELVAVRARNFEGSFEEAHVEA